MDKLKDSVFQNIDNEVWLGNNPAEEVIFKINEIVEWINKQDYRIKETNELIVAAKKSIDSYKEDQIPPMYRLHGLWHK